MDRSVFEAPIGGHGVRFYSGYSSRVADSSGVNPVRIRPSKKPDPDITVKKPRSGYDRQKKNWIQIQALKTPFIDLFRCKIQYS